MNNLPVSIVTICYNAQDELPATLDSVLAQDFTSYEYIIQDGNSTDNTPAIIEEYKAKFEAKGISFIYNREPDKGIYDAMNKATLCASGKYVNFMNAGDFFYSSKVLTSVFSGKDYDEAVLYGDCAEYEYGRYYLFIKNLNGIEENMPFSHQSVFARRDFLLEHPFDLKLRYSADYDFLLTAHDLKAGFKDTGVIICITNKDGLSSVNYHDMLIESANILKSHGLYHHSEEELATIEKNLKLKQFVLDHFPVFIKKAIRGYQINKRGQNFSVEIPPWAKS